jgi:hypothetical protein
LCITEILSLKQATKLSLEAIDLTGDSLDERLVDQD